MLPGVLPVTLWVISGAGRGAGKTWLCQQLCALLPDAVYAKLGHHAPRPDKAENYFTNPAAFLSFYQQLAPNQTCILESNRPELRRRADLRLFIAAPAALCRPLLRLLVI